MGANNMICPRCQTDLPERANFCLACGYSLQPEQSALKTNIVKEAERRQITALFSDLTGFTSLTEKLDPEEVKGIMGAIFTGVKEIVNKYEGFIDRLLGDGVLVLFGVPNAHEDDAIRALNVAIEIHQFVGGLNPRFETLIKNPLSMHSGINTGLVVTAEVDPEKGTQGVTGDAVNIASRLSGLAGSDEILIGEETARRAKGRFVLKDLGKRQIKGKAEPITVFKVVSAQATAPFADRQVSSAMVGREKELDRLELQVMKAVNGEGSVVNVVGEAGIGKSRLMAELKQSATMRRVTLLEGRAISIGKNLSFHPIIDLLKQWAGIAEDDSETTSFYKLEHSIRTVDPREANEIIPFVGTLMGMKLR